MEWFSKLPCVHACARTRGLSTFYHTSTPLHLKYQLFCSCLISTKFFGEMQGFPPRSLQQNAFAGNTADTDAGTANTDAY